MTLILALDLAQRSGWALGTPNCGVPESGSIRWAKEGASMACVFSECRRQLGDFLLQHPGIELVVFEAPLIVSWMKAPRRPETERILIGLCAVVEELIYTGNAMGYFSRQHIDCREAQVRDVRTHFLGSNRYKREAAKLWTLTKCRQLGWNPVDDNAADALALWDYQRSIIIKDNLLKRAG